MMIYLLFIAAILGSFFASPACAGTLCSFKQVATLPLTDTDYTISTTGQIENNDLSFLIDTGSEGGLLTPEALKRFSLSSHSTLKTIIAGSDGSNHIVPNLTVHSLTIGTLHLSDKVFPIGELPGTPLLHPPLLGLIGMDILGHYDLDFDLPHNMLTLWQVHLQSQLCARPPYWPEKNSRKAIKTLTTKHETNRFMIPFILDGHTGLALVDSGARSHILSLSFAHKIGLKDEELAQDPGGYSAGINSKERRYQWHKFRQLRIGDEVNNNPILTISHMENHVDMLLGADWFKTHHVWISGETGQIYTYRLDP